MLVQPLFVTWMTDDRSVDPWVARVCDTTARRVNISEERRPTRNVTAVEQIEAEKALRESEARFRELADNINPKAEQQKTIANVIWPAEFTSRAPSGSSRRLRIPRWSDASKPQCYSCRRHTQTKAWLADPPSSNGPAPILGCSENLYANARFSRPCAHALTRYAHLYRTNNTTAL